MRRVLHETCRQYVARRLSEGWRVVWQSEYKLILSPPDGKFLRPVDIRNDVETLRPNAAGDECSIALAFGCSACPNHYDCVDEAVADDTSTMVQTQNTAYERDLYNLDNHSVGSGTINSITIYFCIATGNSLYGIAYAKPSQKSGATVTDGTEQNQSGSSWATKSQTYTTNPATGNPYTWAEIDALQVGVQLKSNNADYDARLTQVYVEVDYTAGGETYDETGREQVVLAAVGKGEQLKMVEDREQVISAVVEKTEQLKMVETRSQTILAALSKADLATFGEARIQTILAVCSGNAIASFDETDRSQIILVTIGKAEQLIMVEVRGQVILATIGESNLATFGEAREQEVLAVIGGDAYYRYQEIGREQVILAVISEADLATWLETGKAQTILAVVGESDSCTHVETTREQVILAIVGETDLATWQELAKEQVILAAQDSSVGILYSEIGRLQVILAALGESDVYMSPEFAALFVVEVRAANGDLLAVLKDVYGIALIETLNEPKVVSFLMPGDDAKLANITRARELWLRDVRKDTILAKTRLARREDVRS